jgi:hypothetical protein
MKEYRVRYKRISYGVAIIHAKDLKEAKEMVDDRDFYDEWDNESEYEFNTEITCEGEVKPNEEGERS